MGATTSSPAKEGKPGNKQQIKKNGEKKKKGQTRPTDADGPDPSTMSEGAYKLYLASIKEKNRIADLIGSIPYKEYEYPFENLVFEGGGAKGQVYIGCMQVMEEVGIKPKRVAGASAGAICACLVAAGYTATEIEQIINSDFTDSLIDHRCGFCSFLPSLLINFGWNAAKRFTEKMGEYIAAKLGDPDATFKQLYKKTGVELCIAVVNVNMLSVEYFHPKTSPNMPLRLAVRMSLAIPGIFQAVKLPNNKGSEDIYIDGGLVCNYPIHAFDGWWLSMKPEDSFLNKIQPLSQIQKLMDKKARFGTYNERTVGFLVYSAMEQDLMQSDLDQRVGVDIVNRPESSSLYQSKADILESKEEALFEHQVFLSALDKFLKALKDGNRRPSGGKEDDVIDKQELRQTIQEALSYKCDLADDEACSDLGGMAADSLTAEHIELLFGENADIDAIFDELDVDNSGYISYDELLLFIERSGIDIQAKFQGYDRKDIRGLADFAEGVQECLLTNVKKMYMEVRQIRIRSLFLFSKFPNSSLGIFWERDIHRTVGISSDYIGTTDFHMQDVDRQFCHEQGRRATIAFLRHYVYENKLKKKIQDSGPAVTQAAGSLDDGEASEPEPPTAPLLSG